MELSNISMRQQVERMEAFVREMPQLEVETIHYHMGGVYGRRIVNQPAGSLVIGKAHKKEHWFILLSGRIGVTVGESTEELVAPQVIECKPGAKRAIFAIEDCSYMNVHRTDKTDLDEIEDELIEGDSLALYDCANQLKVT